VLSASKAKIIPTSSKTSNRTSSSCTSHPGVHISYPSTSHRIHRRPQVLRIATSLWPSTDHQEFRSPAGPHAGPRLRARRRSNNPNNPNNAHFFVPRPAMHHESSQSWSQTIHDDPMVVTSSGDDFTNFLELDFQIFDNSSGLEDVQPGLDTPMGDLSMEQLGMSGAIDDGTTGGMQHNAMASHPMSMAPTHAYHKSAGVVDPGMHTQLLHNQHGRARMMQNQNFQPQYMMPLTPHSSEMHGTAATYQHQMDTQGQVVYDRGHVSWTPLVSPAFSIPEYTVPGEYFSPLASPLLQPHRQDTYPSAPSSDTGATGSPVDLHLDTPKAAATSNSTTKKSGRKSSVSARTPARSARQSPLTKSQNRRKPNSMNSSSTSISKVASNHDVGGKPGPFRNGPPESSDGSGPDSVSPEPLTEILMPPPSLPRSAGRSPNIPAQSKSRRSSNEPATPSTLLMKPDKSGTQFSPRTDRDVDMSAVEDSDFMLPEAATSARPTLGIDTRKVDDDDQSTPTLSAKTPKLSANSTPGHTMMSPDIQSPRTTTSHKQGDSKPNSRNSKKRQSTSSAQISPMLVPKISPSIKPLMPSSSLYSSSKLLANKLTPPQALAFPLSQLTRLHSILLPSLITRTF
jgi:hypothetical protein